MATEATHSYAAGVAVARTMACRHAVACAACLAAVAPVPATAGPKQPFHVAALAAKKQFHAEAQADGFVPYYHGLMRRTNGTRTIRVDVSGVKRLHLVAHHTYTNCTLPVVWADAVLIKANGATTRLADLEPAARKTRRNALGRHRDRPLVVGDKTFEHGLWTISPADIAYQLDQNYVRLEATIAVMPRASHNHPIRFKVLNCPNAEDPVAPIWNRLKTTYPVETARFGFDGDYWVARTDANWLEKRLTERTAKRMGTAGQGVVAALKAIDNNTARAPRQRLALLGKAVRLERALQTLRSLDAGALAALAGDTPSVAARLGEFRQEARRLEQGITELKEPAPADLAACAALGNAVLRHALAVRMASNRIVFTTRNPGRDGHWYANFGYWCSDPGRKLYGEGGSRLAVLDLTDGTVSALLEDERGAFRDPQVHYDGQKVLFCYRRGGTEHYKLHEINSDGSGLIQLTHDPFDDIEPTYLPDGGIAFCSSRCNRWVNCFHTQVAILYRCDAKGGNIRPLSSNVEHDNTPWPLPDGRLLYTRWEYVDRSQMAFHHLWTVNPDGTGQMTYYGNQTPGRVFIDAKPIPGSRDVVAIFCPGHGRREHAGAVTVVTPARGPDSPASERTIRPEPVFRDPYPIADGLFLVARDNQLLVMTGEGRTLLLHRADRMLHEPRPIRPRPREHLHPVRTDTAAAHGTMVLQDVYRGRNMAGVRRGSIRKLLILESLPKPVNHSGGMDMLSHLGTFTLERVLGTVPVEADGSAHFLVPPDRPVFFVALGEDDLSIKRMQSFVSAAPGERVSCVGCHESRVEAPTPRDRGTLLALQRPPSRIQRFEGLPDVIDFPRHIQPILDRHCVRCHNYSKRSGGVVMVPDYGARRGDRRFNQSYWTLLARKQLADGANHYGNRAPRTMGTGASPLMAKITKRHHGVKLDERDRRLVWMWLETGAPYAGTYGALLTTAGPPVGRPAWNAIARRCASCHSKAPRRIPSGITGVKPHHYRQVPAGAEKYASPLLFNVSNPEHSMALLAPLAKDAGGYGICPGPVFKTTDDPDYKTILGALKAPADYLMTTTLYHMPRFRPNEHYIREMKRYGVLPQALDPGAEPVDVYHTDQAYWQSLWTAPDHTVFSP